MDYVIKRTEDGKYVARQGSAHAYTTRLQDARAFPTREAAMADCCGNEYVVKVDLAVNYPKR